MGVTKQGDNKKIVAQPDDEEIIAWLDGDFVLCPKCYDKKPDFQKLGYPLHNFTEKVVDIALDHVKQGDVVYCDDCGKKIQWVNYQVPMDEID